MGASDDDAIDLNRLMPDLWPDLEYGPEAGGSDAWLQQADPLLLRFQPARPIEEQDTLMTLPPVQATPPTLILPIAGGRKWLVIAIGALIALIALFLVADTWLIIAHFIPPR